MRKLLSLATAAIAAFAFTSSTTAADVKLRVHHFMSAKASLHDQWLAEWEAQIEAESDNRIEVELFPSMSLGGRPGDLYDQAVDGAVDIILTLPGYTPGRFNRTEVFELPFLMEDAVATSKAYWDLVTSELQSEEFEDVQILAAWVHGPGAIHSKEPIKQLSDMAGKEMRGPTRLATDMLKQLGATPVGMPLPAIPENLSKGVINGTLLPWEITPSIKLAQLLNNHTEISGSKALYTAAFILAMNIDAYDEMPEDLRAILDKTTGKAFSQRAAEIMTTEDKVGRKVAEGNKFFTLENEEVDRWIEAVQPVYDRWIARSADEGFDGQATLDKARELIAANQ